MVFVLARFDVPLPDVVGENSHAVSGDVQGFSQTGRGVPGS
jgi:hypothetical protein